MVTPGFFRAADAPVILGRPLNENDTRRRAAVVNEAFVKQYLADAPPLGERVGTSGETEIVGVVRDLFDVALDRAPSPSVLFLLDRPAGCLGDCNRVNYVIKRAATASPAGQPESVRVVSRINSDAIVVDSGIIADRLMDSIKPRSFATIITALYASAALSVCVAGLVGIVGFVVSSRTKELAIRLAIGASAKDILVTVLTEVLAAVAVGALVGSMVGIWASIAGEKLLYGVHPADPRTCAIAAGVLMLSILATAIVPARRALGLSPSAILKSE
jgi:hypothetical protein